MNIKQKILLVICLAIILFSMSACVYDIPIFNSETESVTSEPVTSPPLKLDDMYHGYNSIRDDKVKEIYTNIGDSAKLLESIPFTVDGEIKDLQMMEALCAYKNDHPEVFWLKNETSYYYQNESTTIQLSYFMSGDKLLSAKKRFNDAVDKALSSAPVNGGDYEKELFVNNYIADNCEYDKSAVETENVKNNENDAYGALVNKKAVCEGYARAFQLLCNKLNIDCVIINGSVKSGNHAWNCAKIAGEWYHVDPTWNDVEDKDVFAKNEYLNLNDARIYKDHTASALYSECSNRDYDEMDEWCNNFVPECSSNKYNYFRQECDILTDINDGSEITKAIADAAKNNSEYFIFVIDDSLDYSSTADELINGRLSEWIYSANDINWYSPQISGSCKVYKNETNRVITCIFDYI